MSSFNKIYNVVISAVCMGLAQHPIGLGWIAWFSLVPLFYTIKDENKFSKIFKYSLIWSFIYHLISLYWLSENIGVPSRSIAIITMILANVVCSINIIIILFIWHLINFFYDKKIWYSLPFIWVAISYLTSITSVAFPWSDIANTQAQESLNFVFQFIEFTGMYGLTFWLVSLNVSLFIFLQNKNKESIIELICIVFLPLVLGLFATKNNFSKIDKIDFGILQPNIHIDDKWKNLSMIDRHLSITKKYVDLVDKKSKEFLLIWPESSFTHQSDEDNYLIKNSLVNSIGQNISLVTGVGEYDGKNNFNSVYYLRKSQSANIKFASKYRKMKLVPGAEHVPFSQFFTKLNDIAISGNFSKGKELTLFDYKSSRFASMICIESTFSDLSRNFVKKGANFLVYIANDGWYENPPEAQQHAKQTLFRAVETRKPVLRCGNTGISWVVDTDGKVKKSLSQNSIGFLSSKDLEIHSNNFKTLYVVLGNWISYISIIVTSFLLFSGVIKRYKK